MTDLLKTGSDWLAGMMKTHAATQVTYTRSPNQSVTVYATFGKARFDVTDSEGIVMQSADRDFLIDVADLILNSETTEPQAGDQISYAFAGGTETFEVMRVNGQAAWDYSDLFHKKYRIHTTRVK